MSTFDLRSPLPTGTTVIEASAGTGKTYAIVGLAVRYVAGGVTDLDHLMLVTFGRAATQELRDRARERFGTCLKALDDPATALTSEDAAIARLATEPVAEVQFRVARLGQALSNASTVATGRPTSERKPWLTISHRTRRRHKAANGATPHAGLKKPDCPVPALNPPELSVPEFPMPELPKPSVPCELPELSRPEL